MSGWEAGDPWFDMSYRLGLSRRHLFGNYHVVGRDLDEPNLFLSGRPGLAAFLLTSVPAFHSTGRNAGLLAKDLQFRPLERHVARCRRCPETDVAMTPHLLEG